MDKLAKGRAPKPLGHSDHLGAFRSFDYIWITLGFGGTWITLGSFDYTWMTLNDYIEGRIVCIYKRCQRAETIRSCY